MSRSIVSGESEHRLWRTQIQNMSKAQNKAGPEKLSWQRLLHFLFDLPLFTPHLVSKDKRTQVWMEASGWYFSRQLHYYSLERMDSKVYTLSHFQRWSEFQVMKALKAKRFIGLGAKH